MDYIVLLFGLIIAFGLLELMWFGDNPLVDPLVVMYIGVVLFFTVSLLPRHIIEMLKKR